MLTRRGSFHIKKTERIESYDPEKETQLAFPVAVLGGVDDRLDDPDDSIRSTGI